MKKSLDDLAVLMKDEGFEARSEEFGDMVISLHTWPPGFDGSPVFASLPDGLCPCSHWGRVLEGEVTLRYADGTEEVTRAGEIYHWPAGHVPWSETGAIVLDLVPTSEARHVNEQLGL